MGQFLYTGKNNKQERTKKCKVYLKQPDVALVRWTILGIILILY